MFFQAEDGIRDVERSRGLGDVYKRQIVDFSYLKEGGIEGRHRYTWRTAFWGNGVRGVRIFWANGLPSGEWGGGAISCTQCIRHGAL